MDKAEPHREPIVITRHGKLSSVLLPAEQWEGIDGARFHQLSPHPRYHRQPFLVSEFGGRRLALSPVGWGFGSKLASQAEFLKHYRDLMGAVHRLPIAGYCHTQLADTRQEHDGLFDEQRRPKVDPAAIRAINSRPLHPSHVYSDTREPTGFRIHR